jgi:heptosyltransferase-2
VGDAVLSHSLIQNIKNNTSNVVIDVASVPWVSAVYHKMPEVSEVIDVPLRHGIFNISELISCGKKLRTRHYDRAFILPRSLKSSLIPYFAKIPKRIGYLGEYRYGIINQIRNYDPLALDQTVKKFTNLERGSTDDSIELLPPKLESNKQRATEILKLNRLAPDTAFIVIAPGAEYGPAKQWPANYFAKLIDYVSASNYEVILLGSPKDNEITQDIMDQCQKKQPLNFVGHLNLSDAIDLLSLSKALVTNDSGLMHVGAALDVPIVAIYGSTSPRMTPPIAKDHVIHWLNLSCGPCFKRACPLTHLRCLKEIYPEQVYSSLSELISIA